MPELPLQTVSNSTAQNIVRAMLGASSKQHVHHLLCRSHISPSDEGDLGASVTVDTNFTSGNDVSSNCCSSCSDCDRRTVISIRMWMN